MNKDSVWEYCKCPPVWTAKYLSMTTSGQCISESGDSDDGQLLCLSLFRFFVSRFLPFSLSPFLSLIKFSLSVSKQSNPARVTFPLVKLFLIRILKHWCHVRFVKILSKFFVEISFSINKPTLKLKIYVVCFKV